MYFEPLLDISAKNIDGIEGISYLQQKRELLQQQQQQQQQQQSPPQETTATATTSTATTASTTTAPEQLNQFFELQAMHKEDEWFR